jgi:hypothetical protein
LLDQQRDQQFVPKSSVREVFNGRNPYVARVSVVLALEGSDLMLSVDRVEELVEAHQNCSIVFDLFKVMIGHSLAKVGRPVIWRRVAAWCNTP